LAAESINALATLVSIGERNLSENQFTNFWLSFGERERGRGESRKKRSFISSLDNELQVQIIDLMLYKGGRSTLVASYIRRKKSRSSDAKSRTLVRCNAYELSPRPLGNWR